MLVSIITPVLNGHSTIEDAIKAVLRQSHKEIEHIVIDGGSTDGTVDIIRSYGNKIAKFISEPDNGIYDAMNKGIKNSTGDVIGTLNSDDFYINNNVISTVVNEFITKKVDSVFANLVYVRANNLDKIVRYYGSDSFYPKKMAYGWMPAHPTFFVKKEIYSQYGLYKTDYVVAADYELVARFLVKNKISYSYIPEVLVKMRTGGMSTRNLRSNWILNKEILRACTENGIKTNIIKIYSKYFTKVFQLFRNPAKEQ